MVAVGILYLIFQKRLLAKSALKGDSTTPAKDNMSRALIGVQVSSLMYVRYRDHQLISVGRTDYTSNDHYKIEPPFAASQAGTSTWKPGCWMACFGYVPLMFAKLDTTDSRDSFIPCHAIAAPTAAQQSLSSPFSGIVLDVFTHLCNS